ncbi:hypothetical protein LguiB_024275 [Lonicera macranthoides]
MEHKDQEPYAKASREKLQEKNQFEETNRSIRRLTYSVIECLLKINVKFLN